MFWNQLKPWAVVILILGAVTAGAGVLARQPAEEVPAPPPRELMMTTMPTYVVEPPDLIVVEVREALEGMPISGERLVRIGAGSWIGAAAVVMADVGPESVVGAGSVVTQPVPGGVVAAGVPSRVVRRNPPPPHLLRVSSVQPASVV